MARIRTVKPEFWTHPVMGRASDQAKCLALALLNYADDDGYFFADSALVRSACRPFDENYHTCTVLLRDLSMLGWIEVKKHPSFGLVGKVVNFTAHQVVNKHKASKIKGYFCDTVSVRYEYGSDTDRKGKEQGKEGNKRVADFEIFWDAFAYKQGRGGAEKAWSNIKGYSPELFDKIIVAAKQEAIRRKSLIDQGKTPKWAQGWLTEKRWEDEYPLVREAWDVRV